MFTRLFGRSLPNDPLFARLREMPVPLAAAGSWVEGLKTNRDNLYRPSSSLGAGSGLVARYHLYWRRPWEAIAAHLKTGEPAPILHLVEQDIALLRDDESARWWLFTITEGVKQREGSKVGGCQYGQLTLASLHDLGDEANLAHIPLSDRHGARHETYVNFRLGRMVGSVNTDAMLGDPRIQTQVEGFARLLARRIEQAQRVAAQQPAS